MFYKCIKELEYEFYDKNGFPTGEYKTVKAGTIWEVSSENYIGGDIHLCRVTGGYTTADWIEISRKDLKEFFRETILLNFDEPYRPEDTE
jgi:hypothetical protein